MGVKVVEEPWFRENIILHTVVGSESHGVMVPNSETDDHDEMAIYIEPPEYIIGLQNWDTFQARTAWERSGTGPRSAEQPRSMKGDTDLVAYGLKKFISLVAKGNPSMIVPLFASEGLIIQLTQPYGDDLLKFARDIVVNKQTAKAFLGYGTAQRKGLDGSLGTKVKRPELVHEFGYDTKYAYHMLRLMLQGIELLTTGEIKLPMVQASRDFLLDVRLGKFELDFLLETAQGLESTLEGIMVNTGLPDGPDMEEVSRFLKSMYIEFWYKKEYY